MQQTNSSERRHLAMGQLSPIRQSRVKGPVSRDTVEIPLWRGDLLIEEVLNVKIRSQFSRTTSCCDLVAPVATCARNSQPSAIVSTATRRDLHCRL